MPEPMPAQSVRPARDDGRANRSLGADIIIANAPDPVFVSDLEGKILQANDAVSQLLGFRPDELVEQSLSRFISPQETREFTAALREVVEKGVTRNARLNPRSASGEVIPTTLNASALRDPQGTVIGAIGILRDMRELDKARAYAESLIKNAPDPVFVSDLRGQDPPGQRRRLATPGLPARRADRAVAVALHQPRGDARVHRRPARGRREGRHPQRPAQPAQRLRRGHPDHPERLRPARPRRAGDRRHRHPPRHARAGQGAGLRREPDQERPGPGVRVGPGRQDPPGQRRRLPGPRVPTRRADRAVAVAVHQPGGDPRVHRRPARGRREGRHPQRPAQPPQRLRRGHPDHAERLGPAGRATAPSSAPSASCATCGSWTRRGPTPRA